jgi:hypothetical protein
MHGMYKLPSIARLGVVALLLLASSVAIPQQSGRYTVEILVFRTASQTAALDGSAARAPMAGSDDIEPTSAAVRRLVGAAGRLRGASGFKVLAHTAWTQGAASFNSRRGVSTAKVGLSAAGITGKVVFERGRLLHLGIDLTIDEGGRRYHISEVRPVKADEVQYFDHPAVGVIAVVSAGG